MSEQTEIDPQLKQQIKQLSDLVHDALNGPDGEGQLTGNMAMQRVILDVPRAFVVLATFLATFDPKQNKPNLFWEQECDNGKNIDQPKTRRLMRKAMQNVLNGGMHDQLHWLATHWFHHDAVRLEVVFSDQGDDDIPF